MSEPLVTVCIPSYSHARFLPGAVESVLQQTYRNVECLIFDDGSQDGSWELAQELQAGDERVRLFTHDGRVNRGITATMNAAYSRAAGVYVAGLAADDLLSPDSVERRMRPFVADARVGFSYGLIEMLDTEGRPTGVRGGVSNEAMRRFDRTDDDLQSLLLHNSIPGPGVLVRKDLFERVGGYSEDVYYSDWELWIKLLAHGGIPSFVDGEPLVGCRPGAYGDEHDLPRRVELFKSLDEKGASIGGRFGEPRIRALVRLQLALQGTQVGSGEAGGALVAAFDADPSLRSDADYLFWWLGPLQRRQLPDAGHDAEVGWLRELPDVARAVAAGAQAGNFGCWAVETATPRLTADAAETLRWAVTANEIEISPARARPRVLRACVVATLRRPGLIRERWFVKSMLCAAGLWSVLARVRRLRAA